jgi:serine/threonine-protein kinase
MITPQRNIGRYEVLGTLGHGGTATVLLGRLRSDSGFERVVALKVLSPEMQDVEGATDMLLDEARLAASIRHPNVAQVQELLETEGCIVMEYLAGASVSRTVGALRQKGDALLPRLACHVVAESLAGLHAAHEHKDARGQPTGLVHRDISPQNLFITYEGSVKVLDFGVARAAGRRTKTETGLIKGKFAYMSPEQSLGQPLDRRSDVFSMGVVLWELLTGRSLFRRTDGAPVARAIVEDPVVAPGRVVEGLPPALDAVCMKALAAEPGERFADAAAFRRELLDVAQKLPLDGPPDEALAKLMHTLFVDERAQSDAILRQARDLGPETAPRRSVAPVLVSIAVVAVLAGAAVAVLRPVPQSPAPQPPAPPPAGVEARVGEVELTPTPTDVVKVEIDSVPRGAEVRLDQRVAGRTPLTLEVARDTKPARLSVRSAGGEAVEQTLVPDRDQKLLLQLPARKVTRGPRAEPDPLREKW